MNIARFVHGFLLRVRPVFLASFLKRLLGVRRAMIETRRGRYFADPVSPFGYALKKDGLYKPGMIQVLEDSLRPGSVFVEIGAGEGYFAVQAAKIVGASGRVLVVEPQTRLIEVFKRNLKENGVERIVELCETAVSDEEGPADFYLAPDVDCGKSGLAKTAGNKTSEKVSTMTLLNLFTTKKVGRVDLLKIDINGYEYEAVLGSKELFTGRKMKRIALELYPEMLGERGKSANGLTAFILGCGYRRVEKFDNLVFELKF